MNKKYSFIISILALVIISALTGSEAIGKRKKPETNPGLKTVRVQGYTITIKDWREVTPCFLSKSKKIVNYRGTLAKPLILKINRQRIPLAVGKPVILDMKWNTIESAYLAKDVTLKLCENRITARKNSKIKFAKKRLGKVDNNNNLYIQLINIKDGQSVKVGKNKFNIGRFKTCGIGGDILFDYNRKQKIYYIETITLREPHEVEIGGRKYKLRKDKPVRFKPNRKIFWAHLHGRPRMKFKQFKIAIDSKCGPILFYPGGAVSNFIPWFGKEMRKNKMKKIWRKLIRVGGQEILFQKNRFNFYESGELATGMIDRPATLVVNGKKTRIDIKQYASATRKINKPKALLFNKKGEIIRVLDSVTMNIREQIRDDKIMCDIN